MRSAVVCLLAAGCGGDVTTKGGMPDAGESDAAQLTADARDPSPDRSVPWAVDTGVRRDGPPASMDSGPITLMTMISTPGAVLFQDDFAAATLPRAWRDGKGTWTVESGAIRGSEVPAEMHPAGIAHDMAVHNFIIELKFKLDTSSGISVMINEAGPVHNCRIGIRPSMLAVYRTTGYGPTTSNTVLGTKRVTLDPQRWYTLLVEVVGNQMVAQLDTGDVARGTAPSGIDVDHTSVTLQVDNGSALFDDVRVWTAVSR